MFNVKYRQFLRSNLLYLPETPRSNLISSGKLLRRPKLDLVTFYMSNWFILLVILQPWASEYPDIKNYKWRLNPVWHRLLYSCTHIATVGVKGLMLTFNSN